MESFDTLDLEQPLQDWNISQAISSTPYGATSALHLAWSPSGMHADLHIVHCAADAPACAALSAELRLTPGMAALYKDEGRREVLHLFQPPRAD